MTLLQGSMDIPNLSLLGLDRATLATCYLAEDHTTPTAPIYSCVKWYATWREYVRGNIVSDAAAAYIRRFLLQTEGATHDGGENNDDSDNEADDDHEIAPMIVPVTSLNHLIAPQDIDEEDNTSTKWSQKSRRQLLKADFVSSLRIASQLWSCEVSVTDALGAGLMEGVARGAGSMYADVYHEHLVAKRHRSAKEQETAAAFDSDRCAAAAWHTERGYQNLDQILACIMKTSPGPNQEQLQFLEHFVTRLKIEILEQQQRTMDSSQEAPLLDLVHGLPGTGKSRVIAWMREIMETALGWTHGVQFVFLAFQNVMAASINGFTLHHWSGIPAHYAEGDGTGDKHAQSIKCQALRVIQDGRGSHRFFVFFCSVIRYVGKPMQTFQLFLLGTNSRSLSQRKVLRAGFEPHAFKKVC